MITEFPIGSNNELNNVKKEELIVNKKPLQVRIETVFNIILLKILSNNKFLCVIINGYKINSWREFFSIKSNPVIFSKVFSNLSSC